MPTPARTKRPGQWWVLPTIGLNGVKSFTHHCEPLLHRRRQLHHIIDVAAGPRALLPFLERELVGDGEV